MDLYNCPIIYFEDNIIVNSAGEFRAVYEIPPIHFDFLSFEEQLYWGELWEEFLATLDDECHLLVIPEIREFSGHFKQLYNRVPEHLNQTGKAFFKRTFSHLQQEKEMIMSHFFLSVKLVNANFNIKKLSLFERLKYILKDTKRQLLNLGGVQPFYFLEEEMAEYHRAEQRLYEKIKSLFGGWRVDTDTIQWLLRRSVWRGIDEPPLRMGWKPTTETIQTKKGPVKKPTGDIMTLFGGLQSDQYQRMLVLEQFHKGKFRQSYVSFLVLTYLPDDRELPGFPWTYWIQEVDFPIEMSIRVKPLEHRKAIKKVRNKQAELDEQFDHISEVGGNISRKLQESIEEASQLEYDLSTDKFPILHTTVMFCVYADTEEKLQSNIDKLMYLYESNKFEIDIPRSDQWYSFSEFLLGSQQFIDQYQYPLNPTYIAGGMFATTRDLGDLDGFYLGPSGNQPVFINPRRAPADSHISTSPSIAFVGATGKGKSVAVNFLALNELMLGAQILIIDPKGDRVLWSELMPKEIRNIMQVVSLGEQEKDRGKLDPLVGDPKGGENTAKRILKVLTATKDGSFEATAIEEAVEASIKSSNPCMLDVVERLEQHLEKLKLGRKEGRVTDTRYDQFNSMIYTLKQRAKASQSMLLFGDGSQESINLNKPLTILQIQDLPNIGRDKEQELLGLSLLISLADFSRRFANQQSKHFKISIFDEAWRLAKTDEGQAVLEELIRTGRSQNSALYIVTQNARDLSFGDLDKEGDRGEEIRGNLGMRFCFHAKDRKDAISSCHLLGIEPIDENIRRLNNLKPGQCLMADLEGRVGEVEFIIEEIHEEIFNILDTRPESYQKQQDELMRKKENDPE